MPSSGPNRRLATILFADIDGHSRLMRAEKAVVIGPNGQRLSYSALAADSGEAAAQSIAAARGSRS